MNLFEYTACLGHTLTQFAYLVLIDMLQMNAAGREEENRLYRFLTF